MTDVKMTEPQTTLTKPRNEYIQTKKMQRMPQKEKKANKARMATTTSPCVCDVFR